MRAFVVRPRCFAARAKLRLFNEPPAHSASRCSAISAALHKSVSVAQISQFGQEVSGKPVQDGSESESRSDAFSWIVVFLVFRLRN